MILNYNPQMSDLNIQIDDKPLIVDTSADPIKVMGVSTTPRSFFNCYTIFLIVSFALKTASYFINLVLKFDLLHLISLLISALFLTWTIYLLLQFKKSNEYGSQLGFVFSLVTLAFVVIVFAVAALFFVITLLLFSYMSLFHPDHHHKNKVGGGLGLTVFLLIVFGIYLPLNKTYHEIIKDRVNYLGNLDPQKNQNAHEKPEGQEEPEESKVNPIAIPGL